MQDDNGFAVEERFEARFPPDAFVGIAEALGLACTPKSLANLAEWLRPEFYAFYLMAPQEPTRAERLKALRKARQAARALDATLDEIWLDLPMDLLETEGGVHQFRGAVRQLASAAEHQLARLRKEPSPRGRPQKNAFRELSARLVWVYERLMHRTARRPHWLPDSRVYGGTFFRFVRAVWQCLREHIPEAHSALPRSEGALAQELKKHWPQRQRTTGRKMSIAQ